MLKKIIQPTHCPSCSSLLEEVNSQLFCRSSKCTAVASKTVEHFLKTMKIKGCGPKSIEKLEWLSIPDIYNATEAEISSVLGATIATKLFREIENSKNPELSTFLAAFSIPLIGNTAAKKLAKLITDIDQVTYDICKDSGLGDKATANLIKWVNTVWIGEDYRNSLPIIPVNSLYIDPLVRASESLMPGSNATPNSVNSTVVITGKLNEYNKTRAAATEHLESLGFTVKSSVSSKTDYLVCEEQDKESSSLKKARTLGVTVVTVNELLNLYKKDN